MKRAPSMASAAATARTLQFSRLSPTDNAAGYPRSGIAVGLRLEIVCFSHGNDYRPADERFCANE